jgi:hypothetical protein
MKRNTWGRVLSLLVLAAFLSAATPTVLAAKGAQGTPATVLFDDILGHAIQSDGLGPYDGVVRNRDGSLTVETGERALFIDVGGASGLQPITGMTITVSSLNGTTATAAFERSYPDGALAIIMTVRVSRSGSTYDLESISDAEYRTAYRQRVSGRTPNGGKLVWFASFRDMPWGAQVSN